MSLAAFFGQIGPYLLGQREHDDVVRRLYGQGGAGSAVDAERLRIYGRFCRIHRQEALDSVFNYCRDVVLRHGGEALWDDLVERYFVAHPMHHYELNQNGVHFPDFVADRATALELPAFLGELGHFEWQEWLTDSAADDPADAEPSGGPLRLHSTALLHPYSYDLIAWIDDDRRESAEPQRQSNVVLFWRNPDLKPRRAHAEMLEMLVIKAVLESVPLDAALAARIGVPGSALQEVVADLRDAGILLGETPT